MRLVVLPFLLSPLLACTAPRQPERIGRGPEAGLADPVPVSGLESIEANWKERLEQPYLFVEHRGDYRDLGQAMRALFAAAADLSLKAEGPPFALFFDDPGRVPVSELRARACLPVAARPDRCGNMGFEVLPRAMVVYARVSGAYPDVARSYPALFGYLRELGWQAGGPVREVYLVNPQDVAQYTELVTEVQIPWVAARQE